MAGPSGTTRFARGRSDGVSLRMNCHQMKKPVERMNPTMMKGPRKRRGDDEPRGRKHVMLSAGQRLAFVKIVLYHPGADEGEPHLLYGVLGNFRVPAG